MLIGACLDSLIQTEVGLILEVEAAETVIPEPSVLKLTLCNGMNILEGLPVRREYQAIGDSSSRPHLLALAINEKWQCRNTKSTTAAGGDNGNVILQTPRTQILEHAYQIRHADQKDRLLG